MRQIEKYGTNEMAAACSHPATVVTGDLRWVLYTEVIMAFSQNDVIQLDLVMDRFGDEVRNSWQYKITTTPAPTISAANIAEAWWNHVKTQYRAQVATAFGDAFREVQCKTLMSSTGDYGTFGIPPGEQPGTRSTPAGDSAANFLAVGAKLNVQTRVTRPGHKRFGFLFEADSAANTMQAAMLTLCENICIAARTPTLGIPALGIELLGQVVRKTTQGLLLTSQEWTSFTVSNIVTTQNTRKVGRGI